MRKCYQNSILAAVCAGVFMHTLAEDFSRVALQGEFRPLSMNISTNTRQTAGLDEYARPSAEIGTRIMIVEKLGVDLMAGLFVRSGVTYDSATNTKSEPAYGCGTLGAGLWFELLGHDITSLGLIAGYNAIIAAHKHISNSFNYGYNYVQGYANVAHIIMLGFEPSVSIGSHLQVYTDLGASLTLQPPTEYLVYDAAQNDEVSKKRDDRSIIVDVCGLTIGIRYKF